MFVLAQLPDSQDGHGTAADDGLRDATQQERVVAVAPAGPGGDDVEGVGGGIEAVREVQRHADGPAGALGAVCGDDDRLEHTWRSAGAVKSRAVSAAFCTPRAHCRPMDFEMGLVLAPVDGSDAAEAAVEYAVAVAERYGADLHLLHVLDERVMRDLDAGDVAAESVAEHHRAFAADVREDLPTDVHLSTSSAAGFSPGRLAQTPGSVILDSAEELDAQSWMAISISKLWAPVVSNPTFL